MDTNKYNQKVVLLCPTCGNSELKHEFDSEDNVSLIQCPSCGRELTKDELIQENSENININLEELKGEIKKDITENMRKMFKDAFKGNRNIKFR